MKEIPLQTDQPTFAHNLEGILLRTSRTMGTGIVDISSAPLHKAGSLLSAQDTRSQLVANIGACAGLITNFNTSVTAEVTPQAVSGLLQGLAAGINDRISPKPGAFRRHDTPHEHQIPAAEVPKATAQFIVTLTQKLNDPETDPIALAAWVEHEFDGRIHPLADGCGRVAKLTSAMVLQRHGKSLPHYPDRSAYYQAISSAPEDWEQYYRTFFHTERGQIDEQTRTFIQSRLEGYQRGNKELPIWQSGKMQEICEKMAQPGSKLVVKAEPGSGKSTQIPQALHAIGLTGDGDVIVVNNKVDITRTVAQRVETEMDVPVQYITGPYKSKQQSPIKFVTSGVLLRMLANNPSLQGTSTVLFDEFDERDLKSDMGASIVENALAAGSAARMLIMSATVDTEKVSEFFGAQVVEVPGRTYPVETSNVSEDPEQEDLPDVAAADVLKLFSQPDKRGNMLIFMPGKAEIDATAQAVRRALKDECGDVEVIPFHGELEEDEKARAFLEDGKRRVIIATNIAERGLTFPNIIHTGDSGYARQIEYNPDLDTTRLELIRIAKDSAKQREGRAGRTAPGTCTRYYTRETHEKMKKSTKPEIQRLPLRELLLQMKSAGFDRENYPLRIMDMPKKAAWKAAKQQLFALGALEEDTVSDGKKITKLSEMGLKMGELGCDVRDARAIIEADKLGVVRDMITLTALRDGRRLLYLPQDPDRRSSIVHNQSRLPTHASSDLGRLLAIYRLAESKDMKDDTFWKDCGISRPAFMSIRLRIRELTEQAKRAGLTVETETQIPFGAAHIQSLQAGYAERGMTFVEKTKYGLVYEDKEGNRYTLGKESVLKSHNPPPNKIIAHGTMQIGSGNRVFTIITQATAVTVRNAD